MPPPDPAAGLRARPTLCSGWPPSRRPRWRSRAPHPPALEVLTLVLAGAFLVIVDGPLRLSRWARWRSTSTPIVTRPNGSPGALSDRAFGDGGRRPRGLRAPAPSSRSGWRAWPRPPSSSSSSRSSLALPFVFAGAAVSAALTPRSGLPVGRLYAVDLRGRGRGAHRLFQRSSTCSTRVAPSVLVGALAAVSSVGLASAGADAKRMRAGVDRGGGLSWCWRGSTGATAKGLVPLGGVKGHAEERALVGGGESGTATRRIQITREGIIPAQLWGPGASARRPGSCSAGVHHRRGRRHGVLRGRRSGQRHLPLVRRDHLWSTRCGPRGRWR